MNLLYERNTFVLKMLAFVFSFSKQIKVSARPFTFTRSNKKKVIRIDACYTRRVVVKAVVSAWITRFGFPAFVLGFPFAIHGNPAAEGPQVAAPAEQGTVRSPEPPSATKMMTPPLGSLQQDSVNDLSLTVGKAIVIDVARPATRVLVGLGDFAEAIALSPTQIVVEGKAAGETSLIFWDVDGGREFFNITVLPGTLEVFRHQLRAELPGQDVNVTSEGSNIYLRGTVNDLNSSNRAVLIAGTMGKVINLLNVKVPAAEPQILL